MGWREPMGSMKVLAGCGLLTGRFKLLPQGADAFRRFVFQLVEQLTDLAFALGGCFLEFLEKIVEHPFLSQVFHPEVFQFLGRGSLESLHTPHVFFYLVKHCSD